MDLRKSYSFLSINSPFVRTMLNSSFPAMFMAEEKEILQLSDGKDLKWIISILKEVYPSILESGCSPE